MSSSSQAAFHKLDPILRMLLSSVESYREACNTANDAAIISEERILGILRVQVRILENLEKTMKDVVQEYGAGSLQVQTEYILLPLRLILQSSEWSNNTENPIRQSAIWKSSETAARVMESTVTLIGSLISFKQSLECITACTFPLPTEQLSTTTKELDHGDGCMYAVLHCIDTLLECANEQKSYDEEVCMAMEGNLVARISFSCTMLLAPDSRKSSPQVQLQALSTLDTLMKVAPVPAKWQSYFPGLFAVLSGLVLSELRLAPAQATPKVSSRTCRTLSKLLCLSLSTLPEQKDDDPMDAWKRLQQMSVNSSDDKIESTTSEFFQQVHARLPAPLILLLNLLPTATSPKLRAAASDLCHAILVETRTVWEHDQTCTVLQSAMECCIALSRDNDERVVVAAKTTIEDYRCHSGKRDVDSAIGPRILELIEELPALARSGRETELRGRINLISGYLMLGASLRSSLMSVAKEIQTSLAVLFDVDFDSIQYAPRVETMDAWNVWQPDRCRFRFMTDGTAKSAQEMVHLLGASLGLKGASSFVDACVADVLEACIATNHALFGPIQVEWLHQWIGFIVIANEILVGAFKESNSSLEDGDEQNGDGKDPKLPPSRQSRKRLRRLHSLAGAILPVITSAPLWTLPTVLDNVDEKPETTQSMTISEVRGDLEVQPTVSASALKGNAAMVCSLIGILGETVDLLSNEAESFLSIILFPLCEKASSQNHSQVQRTAALALHRVAAACGCSSTRELIRENFDYLFGAMLSRVRSPGGQQTGYHTSFPTTIPSIVQIVLRSATDVDTAADGIPSKRSLSDETCVSYVIELVNALVSSFDSNLVILNNDPTLQASTSLELVEVFDAALSFVASTFGLSLEKEVDPFAEVPIPDANEEWMSTLEPFRRLKTDGLTVKEGFEAIRDEQGEKDAEASTEGDLPAIEITNGELDLISLALARCSFFLSSSSLHVEMASCVGMQHAFALLGHVAIHTQPKEDESNGPKTAILRHCNQAWPPILSRVRSLSSAIIAAAGTKVVSIRSLSATTPSMSPDITAQMIFLSKLFGLIASMCEASGDFMVSRIKEYLWPLIAELLNLYVQEEKVTTNRLTSTSDSLVSSDTIRKKTFATEREKLLFSILGFVARIYGERECGVHLAGLIPAAGTILLPFLSNEGELRARTMRTLKTMMLIDCDALWRPLLQLSHQPLPPRPFSPQSTIIIVEATRECTTPLELAAEELIEFIESLPEQPLNLD